MQINRCEFWDCEKFLKRTENRPLCIEEISNSMAGIPEISLQFEYDDLKYIIVLPHISMASKLKLPKAPCLFATVDYQGGDEPAVTFYSEDISND